jgi:hypothetical protein
MAMKQQTQFLCDYWYLNVKHTLKDPVDIAAKLDYWYLNLKYTLKDPVDIATKFDYWYLNVKHTLKDPVETTNTVPVGDLLLLCRQDSQHSSSG